MTSPAPERAGPCVHVTIIAPSSPLPPFLTGGTLGSGARGEQAGGGERGVRPPACLMLQPVPVTVPDSTPTCRTCFCRRSQKHGSWLGLRKEIHRATKRDGPRPLYAGHGVALLFRLCVSISAPRRWLCLQLRTPPHDCMGAVRSSRSHGHRREHEKVGLLLRHVKQKHWTESF